MKINKRTEKLIREAAVLGFAQGAWWAEYHKTPNKPYPHDSEVVHRVIHDAKFNTSDLYPTLAKVESEAFDEMERQCQQQRNDFLRAIVEEHNK